MGFGEPGTKGESVEMSYYEPKEGATNLCELSNAQGPYEGRGLLFLFLLSKLVFNQFM
jgi:hypothetical protein